LADTERRPSRRSRVGLVMASKRQEKVAFLT